MINNKKGHAERLSLNYQDTRVIVLLTQQRCEGIVVPLFVRKYLFKEKPRAVVIL